MAISPSENEKEVLEPMAIVDKEVHLGVKGSNVCEKEENDNRQGVSSWMGRGKGESFVFPKSSMSYQRRKEPQDRNNGFLGAPVSHVVVVSLVFLIFRTNDGTNETILTLYFPIFRT